MNFWGLPKTSRRIKLIDLLLVFASAHALGDLALQTTHMGEGKAFNFYVMLAHCLVYSGCISVAMKYTQRYATWKALLVLISHMVIDYGHIWMQSEVSYALTVDQFLHGLVLLIVMRRG